MVVPLIPAGLGRSVWIKGQPGLHSKSQASQDYTERPCLKGKEKRFLLLGNFTPTHIYNVSISYLSSTTLLLFPGHSSTHLSSIFRSSPFSKIHQVQFVLPTGLLTGLLADHSCSEFRNAMAMSYGEPSRSEHSSHPSAPAFFSPSLPWCSLSLPVVDTDVPFMIETQ